MIGGLDSYRYTSMYIFIFMIFSKGQLIPEDDCEVLAGTRQAGYINGPNENATFDGIGGIVWRYDELLVAQKGCVRGVSATYTRTLAGLCSQIASDIDGTSEEARFGMLLGIDFDAEGNVYVIDYNKVKMLGVDDYTTTVLDFNDRQLGLSVKGNTMLISGIYNVWNCSILNWSCQSLAGDPYMGGYLEGANNESLLSYAFDVISIWDSVIFSDRRNYCLRQIVNGQTRTFFGVCTEDDWLFLRWLAVSNYETLLVTDSFTLREIDEYGNDTILATFEDTIHDVEVVGDDLYISFYSYIQKCKWKSMFTTSSPTPSPTLMPTSTPTEVERPTERPTPTPNQIVVEYVMQNYFVTVFLAVMVPLLLLCCIMVYCIHRLVMEVQRVGIGKHLQPL